MKKKILLLCLALLSLIGASAQTFPTVSTSDKEVWYYIQCIPRTSNANAKWLTGCIEDPAQFLTIAVMSKTDESQLWKLVENQTGFALVNKQYGTYLNSDMPRTTDANSVLNSIATMPSIALKVWPYYDQVAQPDGFYLVDVLATTPVTNSANSTMVFSFYSAGGGTQYRPMTYGSNPPNVNSCIKFRLPKDMLKDEIAASTKVLNSISVGERPGQITEENRNQLFMTLELAQSTLDDPTSTAANCMSAVDELVAISSIFKANVTAPQISTGGNDHWYLFQNTSIPGKYLQSMGSAASVYSKAFTSGDDTQLWKIVANTNGTADGYALQNKATGEFINTDVANDTDVPTISALPIVNLTAVISNVITDGAYRYWIKSTTASPSFLMHNGSGDATKNLTGGGTWLIIPSEDGELVEYLTARSKVRSFYDASVEGVEFGQYLAEKRTIFLNFIVAQEAKDASTMSKADLLSSTQAINDALSAYVCNGDLSTLSSVTKFKWFRLISNPAPTATYCYGKAMSSVGRTVDMATYQGKFTYASKDLNSDNQLFRFVMNLEDTKATTIVNKANGYYMGLSGNILSTPAADNEFEITRLNNESFWIKPTTSSPLHAADYNTEILNWNDGLGSASSWKLEYVKTEEVTDYLPIYIAIRSQARTKYDAVLLLSGNEIGQYSTGSVGAFAAVLTVEETKDAASLSQEQLLKGINDLKAAHAGLTINTDVKLLVSTTSDKVKWFRIINAASPSITYASGKAISSADRILKDPFTFVNKDVTTDTQLFRFELTADQSKVASIYNKAIGAYMSPTGTILSKDSISQLTNEFEIKQLSGGTSFWIHPTYMDVADPADPYRVNPLHAAETGLLIVNWDAGVGSASAWTFEFVKEETTAVKNVEAFKYRVRTDNRIVTVDGVDNFEVYSVLGQKQNRYKMLTTGVYFVKVKNAVKKIVIN